ncbi:MAG: hypothetical protein HOM68_12150 [Gemmatimonadetes bacterium]|jgi:chromosome segregation ATPase|nr:hypothetical protein [Gemmatimonadota bacterium]MBT5057284.1 hypothetical protein [Gemmatimonadota bacterium]MBT5146713.1 hypothetical protein [Gemmatimonadota bacterium]MBT5588601.1 hypothetical protein [Gemmatimonadota bacterium]MBT5962581.1 hypothetical protein [Gemmatimonadota bacterium]
MSIHPGRHLRRHLSSLGTLALAAAMATLMACGPSEEELALVALQEDLTLAGGTIDSLNYTIESTNLLIDEMRDRVDSLNIVDTKLLESVQRLNKEVRHWRDLAGEHQRKNEQLSRQIETLKRDKQGDQRAIAQLRSQADSINSALLDAHTSIRRQEDHIRNMEQELGKSQDEVALLREAQVSVRLYAASEDYLKESGYLRVKRPFGGGFRKDYNLLQPLDATDPRVRLAPIDETIEIEGKIDVLVDRYGKVNKNAYERRTLDNGATAITFTDGLYGGADVLIVLK